jgi:uncharacterized membrane protein (DUF2068 family)
MSKSGQSHHTRGLWLIAIFKLLKGVALLAVAIGALRLLHKNVAAEVEHWISMFQVDPHNHYIHLLLEKLSILDERRLKELSVGTFFYSAIFLTEGVGLALGKRWAEYFTMIVTASFLPLEIYEVTRRLNFVRSGVLLLNVAIVVYLVRDLRRTARGK